MPKNFDYEIEWNSAFELNELDEARISLMQEQGNSLKLEYMLKDEVRAEKNLPPLPLGEGQTLKQSQTPSSFGVSTSPARSELSRCKGFRMRTLSLLLQCRSLSMPLKLVR